MSKLCLGTVQFGTNYGIKNDLGRQPDQQEVFNLLDKAVDSGIEYFDTASVYGTAENVLGNYGIGKKNVRVISKLKPDAAVDEIEEEIKASLQRLDLESLDGYLLHSAQDFYRSGVMQQLVRCKEKGLVKHIGVSVYNPEDALNVVRSKICDYIQIPYNVFDRRLDKTDFFTIAKQNNVMVFARSAFLQGLLLMDIDKVPANLTEVVPYLQIFEKICRRYEFSKAEAAFLYSYVHSGIDKIVFGVETIAQLEDNLQIAAKNGKFSDCFAELNENFNDIPRKIIIPSLWEK